MLTAVNHKYTSMKYYIPIKAALLLIIIVTQVFVIASVFARIRRMETLKKLNAFDAAVVSNNAAGNFTESEKVLAQWRAFNATNKNW